MGNLGKPRGCLSDAINADAFVIVKACARLNLTYELKIATFMALQNGRKLRLLISETTATSSALLGYVQQHGIRLETFKR
jgi:hypothetical protein